jgi:hypothetical protein
VTTQLILISLFFEIAGIVFCALLLVIFFAVILFRQKYRRIRCQTLDMQKPVWKEGKFFRKPLVENEFNAALVFAESFLRKAAYRNVPIKTGSSFFDDSDMQSAYRLFVIYDCRTKMPLLSARYYAHNGIIENCLESEGNSGVTQLKQTILLDRLSGNISNALYRRNRKYIFTLFYAEIFRHNRNSRMLVMARSTRKEKLLESYLRLNFKTIGSVQHHEKQHWVLSADLEQSYRRVQLFSLLRILLFVKTFSFFSR